METRDLVRTVCPPIATLGSRFYFDPATLARGKEVGLDGFRLYVLGRGGVLGDVEAAVVHSAFGYFNPALVAKIWNSAKEVMSPRDGGRLYMECAGAFGSSKLGDVAGLDAFNAVADKVIDAGLVDSSAQALFAAIASEPRSDEAAARAYQNVAVLRELRGSLHLVAIVRSSGRTRPRGSPDGTAPSCSGARCSRRRNPHPAAADAGCGWCRRPQAALRVGAPAGPG